jgi:hypothetical protein
MTEAHAVQYRTVHTVDMRGYVGVTDNEWYAFLASRPEITQVNFWRPGGKEFRATPRSGYR